MFRDLLPNPDRGSTARRMIRSACLPTFLVLAAGTSASAQPGGSLFNGDLDPFNKDNKLGGSIKTPRFRTPQESTSGLTVITGPAMDRDGYISGGSSRSDYPQSRVGRGELRFDSEGRASWYSNYSNNFGRVNSPVRAFPQYDRVAEVRRERERRDTQERQRREAVRRQQEQREVQERRRQEQARREQEQARREQEQRELARGVAGLVDGLAAEARRQRADRQAREAMRPADPGWPVPEGEAPVLDDRPAPDLAPPAQPAGAFFAANLGIYYQMDRYQDGTFGARVVRPPAANSPAARLGFEPGDVIFALDDQRFRTPDDVLAHRGQTSVNFVNVRGGAAQSANLILP